MGKVEIDQAKMEQKISLLWGCILISTFIISIGIMMAAIEIFHIGAWVGFGIFVLANVLFLAIIFANSFVKIEHMHQYIVETLGKYKGYPLEAGMHLILPFGIDRIVNSVYMGERMMALFLNQKITEGYGKGDVEFADTSASLTANFNFEVNDAAAAAYNIKDIPKAIEEKADSALRRFLGLYTLDEAIKLKGKFSIRYIVCMIDLIDRETEDEPKRIKETVISDEEFEGSEFYKTLKSWGVIPISFTISDIDIPDHIKAQREKSLIARENLEAAKIEAQQRIDVAKARKTEVEIEKEIKKIEAEAQQTTDLLIGEGIAKARASLFVESLQALKKHDINAESAAEILTAFRKWEALEKTSNSIIFDGSERVADALKLGTGFNIANREKIEEPK